MIHKRDRSSRRKPAHSKPELIYDDRRLTEESESEDEDVEYIEPEVIFVERQFPIVLRWPLIWGLVFILIGMVPWSIATANLYPWQPQSVVWMAIVGLFLLAYWSYHFVSWYFTVLILTDQDITFIRQKGYFRRKVSSLTLNNIQSVNHTIPGMQASIFHYGNLDIDTLSGSGHFKLKTFYKPARLQDEILDAMENYRSTYETL